MPPIHDAMPTSKQITINATSFIDLQLKLTKHAKLADPRDLEVEFRFQGRLAEKNDRRPAAPGDDVSHRAFVNSDRVSR
jgi:hypothetical protein